MLVNNQQKILSFFLFFALFVVLLFLTIELPRANPNISISSFSQTTITPDPPHTSEEVIITRIIDGDTVVDNQDRKIRLIGINTPELNKNDILFCFAQKSTNRISELILNKKVIIKKDISDIDKYGRLLRYLWLDDLFINQLFLINQK